MFRPFDLDAEKEESGQLLGTAEDPQGALVLAGQCAGALPGRWVNQGVAPRARIPPLPRRFGVGAAVGGGRRRAAAGLIRVALTDSGLVSVDSDGAEAVGILGRVNYPRLLSLGTSLSLVFQILFEGLCQANTWHSEQTDVSRGM
ncbi:hypothetical protein [Streptomyces sp. NPDC002209]|uniref:hypothetical protein n=1 Tax=Streptomyces sp. NPDC002209 TaxID=3364638 RepID=UPI00369CB43C